MTKPRGRDLGLPFPGETGANNAITDVPGVEVGYRTRIEGDGPLKQGHGPVRTGVTAILPLGRTPEPQPVWAGMYALNGNGEMTGTHWIQDGGYFVGPICITNTHSVGMVHHAATKWMIQTYAESWQGAWGLVGDALRIGVRAGAHRFVGRFGECDHLRQHVRVRRRHVPCLADVVGQIVQRPRTIGL